MSMSYARMNTNFVNVYAATDGPLNPSKPSVLAQAAKVPLRVLVRNLGRVLEADYIVLSNDEAVLSNPGNGTAAPPGGNTYWLSPQASDAFILMPGQCLYAIGVGTAEFVRCSWAISEAIPTDFRP